MKKDDLDITADLAVLSLSDEEKNTLGHAVDEMLEYFALLLEPDLDTIEPTTHSAKRGNKTRPDVVSPVDTSDNLLEAAPELEGRFIVIPNVL